MSKLVEYCINITDGEHGSVLTSQNSEYFFLNNNNIHDNEIVINPTDKSIPKSEFDRINKRVKLEKHDLVIATCGTLGKSYVIPYSEINFVFSRSVGIIKCNREILNPYYLHYYLSTPAVQKRIKLMSKGGVQKHFYISDMMDFDVDVPDMDTQQNIVKTLRVFDEKIQLNNAINAELEALAKTIYDYWFLQFEFPNEEGLPYKSSGGKMVWSEELKREIPEGWGCTKIRDVLAKIPKTTHINTTDYLEFGSIPIIDQSENIIAGYTNDKSSQITLNIGCTVFGDHTRVVKYICFPFARGADGTQILKSNTLRIPDILLYQIVKHIDLSNYGYARHFKFLKDTNVILPNESISNKYVNIVSSMYEMQAKFIFENHELAALRDWLLPMLMNGQVGFKEEGESI